MIYYISITCPLQPISIAIVAADGRTYYAETDGITDSDYTDAQAVAALAALKRNNGDNSSVRTYEEIVADIAAFFAGDPSPQFSIQVNLGTPSDAYIFIPQAFDKSLTTDPGYAAGFNSAAQPASMTDDQSVAQWLSDSHPIATAAIAALQTQRTTEQTQAAIDNP